MGEAKTKRKRSEAPHDETICIGCGFLAVVHRRYPDGIDGAGRKLILETLADIAGQILAIDHDPRNLASFQKYTLTRIAAHLNGETSTHH